MIELTITNVIIGLAAIVIIPIIISVVVDKLFE